MSRQGETMRANEGAAAAAAVTTGVATAVQTAPALPIAEACTT